MGKKIQHAPKINKPYKPLVSVCTPTFNRRPFISMMLECFRHQTYPKDRMEWIIVDDGTDPIKDLIDAANIPQIKYFRVEIKLALGEKRNYMHKHCKGSIIVYMDDDDYYPPERVEHAVEKLMGNKEALCAGSSEMYLYFKHINKMYQCGPYGPNHATAGTFAFKSRLLDDTKYDDHAALAEEKSFLKNYTVPFVQLDPMKTILVFSHIHNTFDKKKMLNSQHPEYFKESNKTVDMFIRRDDETAIKKFFMEEIDALLRVYKEGEPSMKPDVLEQTLKIEEERKRLVEDEMRKNGQVPGAHPPGSIIMQQEGKEPVVLAPEQIIEALQHLQKENTELKQHILRLEATIKQMQTFKPIQLIPDTDNNAPGFLKSSEPSIKPKSEPDIQINL
jgi:glycosyltransferase involved in cell wall biosynthesis